MAEGQIDFEISFFERIVKRDPNFIDALAPLAEAYTQKGLHDKALQIDKRLAKLRPEDPVVHYNLACSFALVSKNQDALQTLERAIQLGYSDFEHLRKDPDFKNLHNDPKFQSLLATKK